MSTTTLPTPVAAPFSPRVPLPQLIDRVRRRKRRQRLVLGLSLALVLGAVAAAVVLLRPRPVPMAQRFRTQAVTRGDVVREVRATGHVDAVSTVLVGAQISGLISTVEVDYNDRVKAGQVLARFDRAALEAQRAQVQALIAAARAQVAQARYDVEASRRNKVRSDELYAARAQSQAEHEAAVTAASLAEARLGAAEAQLAAQQAQHLVARTNLDHAVIRSPIDGVVITRNIDSGQTVASMLATPVLFTVAADLTRMEVVAAVDEADIGEVREGQVAVFTVNAWPDRTFEGRVTEVRNAPRTIQDVVTYGTVVEVENRDLLLKPGMTASVRIRTATVKATERVPNGALHFTPPGEKRRGAEDAVWVLEGAELRRVVVTPGVSDGELTAIGSGVLREGALVAVDLTPGGKKAYGLAAPR